MSSRRRSRGIGIVRVRGMARLVAAPGIVATNRPPTRRSRASGGRSPRCALTVRSRNARSCETRTIAPGKPSTNASSCASPSASRSFVGSSRRSRSAFTRRTAARDDPCRLAAGEPVEQPVEVDAEPDSARTSPPRARRGRRRRARGTARVPRRSGRTSRAVTTALSASRAKAAAAASSSRSAAATPVSRARRPRSVSPRRRSGSCRRWATVARGGSSATTPASGASSPASRRRTVDLPTPFGPTSPMRARGPTSSDAFSRTTCAPWNFVTPVRRARMTMDLLTGRDAAPPGRRADRA